MAKKVDIKEALLGIPRPHFLVGQAVYDQEDKTHILRGTINFSSKNPSIRDRNEKYLPNPHVNGGDVCFAMWNGAHIIGDQLGYSQRTLVNEIRIVPHQLISPDTNLDLEIMLIEEARKVDRNGKSYHLGKLIGTIYQDGNLLVELYADTFARE